MSEARKAPPFNSAGGSSEQIQGHPIEREAQIARLQDQLAELLFQTDENGPGLEELDGLLDRLDEVSPPPEGLLSSPEEELAQFHRQYAPVFEAVETAASSAPSPSPDRRHSSRRLVRLLPIAAALVLLFCTVTAQAFGTDLFSIFVRWTSEVFRLGDSSASTAIVRVRPLEEGETTGYDTLEEALAAFGIDAPIVPKEIPERFELVEVTATQRKVGIWICANYQSKDGSLQIQYREEQIDSFSLEKERGNIEPYFAEEIEHYLLTDLGREKAIWQNGDLECTIIGNVSSEELKSTIDSIYKE